MKATGIVRRIDDLGRIVIPKEIRRTLRIRESDPLEIYTTADGEVIFKKYSPMGDLADFAVQICESIGKNTGRIAAVCDRDSIISLSGAPKRDLLDRPNSRQLEQLMEQRKTYCHNNIIQYHIYFLLSNACFPCLQVLFYLFHNDILTQQKI